MPRWLLSSTRCIASAVPDDVLRARADQLAALAMALHGEAPKRSPGAIHVDGAGPGP